MRLKLTLDGKVHDVSILRRRPHLVLVIDGEEHEVTSVPDIGTGRKEMTVGGHSSAFSRAMHGDMQIVRIGGRTLEVGIVDPFSKSGASGGGQDALKAPMPGAVVSVHAQAGDTVVRGEVLITIESMKLQTAILAPRDGVVGRVQKAVGETFEKDEVLVTLRSEHEEG